jgi:hypothetical protein
LYLLNKREYNRFVLLLLSKCFKILFRTRIVGFSRSVSSFTDINELEMRTFIATVICLCTLAAHSQTPIPEKHRVAITDLISKYSQARENKDTVLLKTLLSSDIDQLVSTGEWREGVSSAVKGMQRSSSANPGTRTLTVEKIRLISSASAIVDCRYEIKNDDGSIRKMWSSFIVVNEKKDVWKIAAIRNMLPAAQ